MDYQQFVANKIQTHSSSGISLPDEFLNSALFPFQRDLVKLALKAGKFCIWANTGLGKTIQQLSWADALIKSGTVQKVLILAPLGVAKQTVVEGQKFGITVKYVPDNNAVVEGINITNYDRIHKIDCSQFEAVVLDESSILKDESAATRNFIIETFKHTEFKLACSATPSPNDYMELGNHCEFLGVMSRSEMLSMFFTHDGGETSKWRLKNHAKKAFWKFVCSWAITVRKPSDLGYDDSGYDLPPLNYQTHTVNTPITPEDGNLFFMDTTSLNGQRHIRKTSMFDRCELAAKLVNNSNEQWIVWAETNAESHLLTQLIIDGTEVKGADSNTHKENSMVKFANGEIRVLITKPKIAGMGMNFQNCHNVIYIGLTHSFEMWYQSVRRVWRFGQTKPVNVHIIQHRLEGAIKANLERKEREALQMGQDMVNEMNTNSIALLKGVKRITVQYNPEQKMIIPDWLTSQSI